MKQRNRSKATKLRIIGGEMRGRPIVYHGESFTRPMKDNVRENLFNLLGNSVRGSICFDFFGGTGALTFESLSRGASRAVVIERSRKAIRTIQETARNLDVTSRIEVLCGDAFYHAQRLLVSPEDDTPWVVFLCPPYAMWDDSLPALNDLIRRTISHAPPGSVLAAETDADFDPDRLPPADWDARSYGGTRLALVRPAMRCGMEC